MWDGLVSLSIPPCRALRGNSGGTVTCVQAQFGSPWVQARGKGVLLPQSEHGGVADRQALLASYLVFLLFFLILFEGPSLERWAAQLFLEGDGPALSATCLQIF